MQEPVTTNEEIVRISTLSIGNRKMTKAVFNQIIQTNPFDGKTNFKADKMIGFVNEKNEWWLLFINRGHLRRYNLDYFKLFAFLSRSTRVQDFRYMVKRIGVNVPDSNEEADDYRSIEESYSVESLEEITALSRQAFDFYKSLEDKQIFIAG